MLHGFRESASAHQAVLRQIERAHEVVDYSLEVAAIDPKSGGQIASEGIANALSLTEHQLQILADPAAMVDRRFARAIVATLQPAYERLDQSRLGMLASLAQRTALDAARQLGLLLSGVLRVEGKREARRATRAYHRALVAIGWETPPIAMTAPVNARACLGDVMNVHPDVRDLPMIYRRLFRLAPVEDPRFLIGREEEMDALTKAKALWDSNRAVSVLIFGARGSGKTSLLNCASSGPFREAPVIRAQFGERVTDGAGMRRFLAALIGIAESDDVVAALAKCKRIVMLEEGERTFLRTMNGFDALREFLRIVSATSPATLWIVSLNQHTYRYLEAAVAIDQYFSYRINAMAVPPDQLKAAILLRHNLSGLRLEYPPPPATDPRLSALRNFVGFRRRADEFFFDCLYRQSEGIFRAAF